MTSSEELKLIATSVSDIIWGSWLTVTSSQELTLSTSDFGLHFNRRWWSLIIDVQIQNTLTLRASSQSVWHTSVELTEALSQWIDCDIIRGTKIDLTSAEELTLQTALKKLALDMNGWHECKIQKHSKIAASSKCETCIIWSYICWIDLGIGNELTIEILYKELIAATAATSSNELTVTCDIIWEIDCDVFETCSGTGNANNSARPRQL